MKLQEARTYAKAFKLLGFIAEVHVNPVTGIKYNSQDDMVVRIVGRKIEV